MYYDHHPRHLLLLLVVCAVSMSYIEPFVPVCITPPLMNITNSLIAIGVLSSISIILVFVAWNWDTLQDQHKSALRRLCVLQGGTARAFPARQMPSQPQRT
jgi:hypothetical protein